MQTVQFDCAADVGGGRIVVYVEIAQGAVDGGGERGGVAAADDGCGRKQAAQAVALVPVDILML